MKQPRAAEQAMCEIQALLDEHYAGRIFLPDVLNGISRIVGAYNNKEQS